MQCLQWPSNQLLFVILLYEKYKKYIEMLNF